MARAGVWGHEQNYTAKIRKPPTPQPELFSLEEENGGGLPAPLSEVAGRQDKVVRRFVEHLAECAPWCKSSMLLCRRWVETLRTPIAEQVIEEPKISCSPCPSRFLVPEPQSAEQLVEVPTVLSPTRIALRIAEHIVNTPVPQGRGQGFFPEQSTTAQTVEQLVDIPFSGGGLFGSLPGQSTTARTVEQLVDIPSSGGGFGQESSSSAGPADEDFTGVFRTFPHGKKVRSAGQVSADLPRHVSSWTPAAYEQSRGSMRRRKRRRRRRRSTRGACKS